MEKVSDVNVLNNTPLPSPSVLMSQVARSQDQAQLVSESRSAICDSLFVPDSRFLLIVGPCSIHDTDACRSYAEKLAELAEEVKDKILVVMRVYFEKPRTTTGWKGLINDPHIDGTFDIETGLRKARELLIWLAELELPVATEALDPISPQYLAELFSWAAIGARTSESQTHREMASGLSMPVGFKNGTDGSLDIAINALKSAASGHRFMGINKQGQVSIIGTSGNPDGHIILRGG